MEKICAVEDSASCKHPDIRDWSLLMAEVGREKDGGVKGILECKEGGAYFSIKKIGGHPFQVQLDILIICVCVEGVTSKTIQ